MSAPPKDPIRALVVDDGHMNRRLCERMLRHLHCEAITAADAHEAREILLKQPVDVVFTDVDLPDMSGDDAIQMFRDAAARTNPDREHAVPIVAVSGAALGDDREDYLAAGFDDYIAKPVSVEAFGTCLKRFN